MAYKIIILGSEGQLGTIISKTLSYNFEIISTSKSGNKFKNIHKLDVTDLSQMESFMSQYDPDIIINAAAITNVDYCENRKNASRHVNVNCLSNIIKTVSLDTKIIHFSSDFVYNGLEISNSEETLPNPINYYGKSKLESENMLIGSNKPYLILRISTLFSDIGDNFFNWVYNSLNNNVKIDVVSDQVVSPSYAYFLSNSLIDLILLDATGLYNYGSNDSISKYEFALRIADEFSLNNELIHQIKTKDVSLFEADRPLDCSLDCTKIKRLFDINLPYLSESLKHLKSKIYE